MDCPSSSGDEIADNSPYTCPTHLIPLTMPITCLGRVRELRGVVSLERGAEGKV